MMMNSWQGSVLLQAARLAFEEGDYERTRRAGSTLIEKGGEAAAEAYGLLAEAALASQDHYTALRVGEAWLAFQPSQPAAYRVLLKVYLHWRDRRLCRSVLAAAQAASAMDEELASLAELVDRFTDDDGTGLIPWRAAQAEAMAGACRQGQWLTVKNLATQILVRIPGDIEAIFWAGYAAFQLQHDEDCLALLESQEAVLAGEDAYRLALGTARRRLGHFRGAATMLTSLAEEAQAPAVALEARAGLAACEFGLGKTDVAERRWLDVLTVEPELESALIGLAGLSGSHPEAIAVLRRLVEERPDLALAWYSLGRLLVGADALAEACACIERALSLRGDFWPGWLALGSIHQSRKHGEAAEACYRQCLRHKTDSAELWSQMCELCLEQGRNEEALGCSLRAIAAAPEARGMWMDLLRVLLRQRQFQDAEPCARLLIDLDPKDPVGYNNLANVLAARGQINAAVEAYQQALVLAPDNPEIRNNLANQLASLCRFSEAEAIYESLLAPLPAARANYLFCLNYDPALSAEAVARRYREVGARYFPEFSHPPHDNERSWQRPLRIGYLSPDFRAHPCYHFYIPLLAHHDHQAFHIHGYSLVRSPDRVTEAVAGMCDQWRNLAGLDAEAAAAQIRRDGIDILIDLAGHTEGSRVDILRYKPAPIQVTWLGFNQTTGLSTVDYFLTDEHIVPSGAESLFTERPWRLATPGNAYRPDPAIPPVSTSPALRRGRVSFACFSRPIRVNADVVATWARILNQVPDSVLVMNSNGFGDEVLQADMRAQFARHGIAGERILMEYVSPPWNSLARVDIGLDCFPHNSGTTLYESLWSGVPFITLADRPPVGRLGAAILRAAGHPEWIAESRDDYVAKAVALAGDIPALARIRAGLRSELATSAICDEPAFARKVEQALRAMWRIYCDGNPLEEQR